MSTHTPKSVPSPDGVPFAEDTRATSDRMLALVEQLRELEHQKRGHPIGSPEFVRLAGETESLSRLVFRWTQMQGALAEESLSQPHGGLRIADVAPRPIHRLLADWREAELRLLGARPGSPEGDRATDEIERIREEYHRLMEEQRAADG